MLGMQNGKKVPGLEENKTFINFNPGMPSRISSDKVMFNSFNPSELAEMFLLKAGRPAFREQGGSVYSFEDDEDLVHRDISEVLDEHFRLPGGMGLDLNAMEAEGNARLVEKILAALDQVIATYKVTVPCPIQYEGKAIIITQEWTLDALEKALNNKGLKLRRLADRSKVIRYKRDRHYMSDQVHLMHEEADRQREEKMLRETMIKEEEDELKHELQTHVQQQLEQAEADPDSQQDPEHAHAENVQQQKASAEAHLRAEKLQQDQRIKQTEAAMKKKEEEADAAQAQAEAWKQKEAEAHLKLQELESKQHKMLSKHQSSKAKYASELQAATEEAKQAADDRLEAEKKLADERAATEQAKCAHKTAIEQAKQMEDEAKAEMAGLQERLEVAQAAKEEVERVTAQMSVDTKKALAKKEEESRKLIRELEIAASQQALEHSKQKKAFEQALREQREREGHLLNEHIQANREREAIKVTAAKQAKQIEALRAQKHASMTEAREAKAKLTLLDKQEADERRATILGNVVMMCAAIGLLAFFGPATVLAASQAAMWQAVGLLLAPLQMGLVSLQVSFMLAVTSVAVGLALLWWFFPKLSRALMKLFWWMIKNPGLSLLLLLLAVMLWHQVKSAGAGTNGIAVDMRDCSCDIYNATVNAASARPAKLDPPPVRVARDALDNGYPTPSLEEYVTLEQFAALASKVDNLVLAIDRLTGVDS